LGLRPFENAEKSCNEQENSSNLVIIRSKDEQDFLSNLLFKTHKIIDNVWIGVKFTNNKFKLIDDSELSFANWGQGSPRNETDYCVQMQSDESSIGQWIDEPCAKKNLVVCQKMQFWSSSRLQNILLQVRKEFQDITKHLNTSLDEAQKEINNFKQNPVPIGFIYVQLPSQPEPKSLWANVEWKDVTADYAGLFFRAEGENASPFGVIQEENAPRLIHVKRVEFQPSANEINILSNGALSAIIDSDHTIKTDRGLQFTVSGGEVRPRNKAMRIWKREK